MMNLGKKVSFGFNAVVAGQKTSGNNEPQLIANSTKGKFTVTSPVTRAMGIAVGEYIQFVNNIDQIERAIQEGNDDIKAIAEELGVDLTTREGQVAVVEACTQWAIVKGQAMLDKVGNPIMVSARLTEKDKRAYIAAHAEEALAAMRDTLIERVGNPDASDEELLAAIELDEIEYPKVPGFTGSKTASTSNATGVGLQLGFTDSNVWGALKKDLGDNAEKKNRIYKVLLDEAVKTTVDGKEITIYPIEFDSDEDPIVRVGK
jgi:sugar-specific transcriptional regulator TrmB